MSDPFSAADPKELQHRLSQLEKENEELNHRLNEALKRLANRDGVHSLASPGEVPQHDHIVQTLRNLKFQDFQPLSLSAYECWKTIKDESSAPRTFVLSHFRSMLAEYILVQGGQHICLRRSPDSESDWADGQEDVLRSIFAKLKLSKKNLDPPRKRFYDNLRQTIDKGFRLLRDMQNAQPAGRLFHPKAKTPFNATQHEALPDFPAEEGDPIRLVVFPGYIVGTSDQVIEKALVYTGPMQLQQTEDK